MKDKEWRIRDLKTKKGNGVIKYIVAECLKRTRGKGDKDIFIEYAKTWLDI